MTKITFNAQAVEPERKFEALPIGDYPCTIVAEAVKPTRDQSGAYLELTLEIAEGAQKGRKLFDRINLKNTAPRAVEVGLSRLSAICHALDIELLEDTNQLLNRSLTVRVGLEKDKATGLPTGRNNIFAYSKIIN
jgi:hypothetical protein